MDEHDAPESGGPIRQVVVSVGLLEDHEVEIAPLVLAAPSNTTRSPLTRLAHVLTAQGDSHRFQPLVTCYRMRRQSFCHSRLAAERTECRSPRSCYDLGERRKCCTSTMSGKM